MSDYQQFPTFGGGCCFYLFCLFVSEVEFSDSPVANNVPHFYGPLYFLFCKCLLKSVTDLGVGMLNLFLTEEV